MPDLFKVTGVSPYTGGDLLIERDGPLVRVRAGSGHDSGEAHLTPPQAGAASVALAAAAEKGAFQ